MLCSETPGGRGSKTGPGPAYATSALCFLLQLCGEAIVECCVLPCVRCRPAGVIAVDLARQMLQLYPNTYALVLSTENLTFNW